MGEEENNGIIEECPSKPPQRQRMVRTLRESGDATTNNWSRDELNIDVPIASPSQFQSAGSGQTPADACALARRYMAEEVEHL